MFSNVLYSNVFFFFFSQKWIKENVTWHSNGTMSYSTRKEFKFIRELSFSDQSTTNITTINVPLLSAYYQSRKMGYYVKAWGLDTVLESYDFNAWVTRTPEELIWGYPEPLFELAKAYLPEDTAPPMDNFGFFTKVRIFDLNRFLFDSLRC